MYSWHYFALAEEAEPGPPPPSSDSYEDDTLGNGDVVAYWRLGESGATAVDLAGTFDLTILSAWTKSQPALINDSDDAMTGDGTQEIADAASGLNPWASAFTIEAWAREELDLTGYRCIASQESYGVNGFRFGRLDSTNGWAFWTDEDAGTIILKSASASSCVVDETAHIVLTRSGGTFTLYKNGSQIAQVTTGTYVAPAGGLRVGGAGAANWLGTLDEVAVYSSAKDAAWVAARYALGVSGVPPEPDTYATDTVANGDLEGYWRLGDTGATVTDSGPNGYDVTRLAGWSTGTPALIDDSDTAMTGDGTTEIGSAPSGLNPWSSAFTVEVWARESVGLTGFRGVASAGIYGGNDVGTGFRFGRQLEQWAVWTSEHGGDIAVKSADTPGLVNAITHLVITRSGSTWLLYVNGVDVMSAGGSTVGSVYVPPAGGMVLGGFGGGHWQGDMDEIAVYSSAKSAGWVAARYALGAP